MVLIIMGVSGCGKTTIGRLLAEKRGAAFYDADDFHPEGNRQKMKSGKPLTDEDRLPWLQRLHALIDEAILQDRSVVLACSALKERYRKILRGPHDSQVMFVHLAGPYDVVARRMQTRTGHYMPPALLASQFSALEPPIDAITVSIEQTQDEIVAAIDRHLPPV
ncbi:gluconokinase [Desulfofustis glycolicus]|uniref:Gluconokinase n=1 Tax=Desulfofustis glycolicus DSM 9705 TaxID=1121409 RepID=A0A1M5VKV2_9BACT|nr:gluconokinase [Desulfofustis glycolicus]MCB2217644.1 gluconokinase [Desulfobulbaceae bacterium]SHH75533.1 gluconate kinase, SKI family [Desulfofustis glycolicus DSM 9705]